MKLIDGKTLDRKSIKNNLIVLNLWGTWCKPCLDEIPELNKLSLEFKNDQVKFLALATDKTVKLNKFLLKKEFNFIHLDNGNKKYFDKGFIKSYPRTLVYDESGQLIKKYSGQLTDEKLSELRVLIKNTLSTKSNKK